VRAKWLSTAVGTRWSDQTRATASLQLHTFAGEKARYIDVAAGSLGDTVTLSAEADDG